MESDLKSFEGLHESLRFYCGREIKLFGILSRQYIVYQMVTMDFRNIKQRSVEEEVLVEGTSCNITLAGS